MHRDHNHGGTDIDEHESEHYKHTGLHNLDDLEPIDDQPTNDAPFYTVDESGYVVVRRSDLDNLRTAADAIYHNPTDLGAAIRAVVDNARTDDTAVDPTRNRVTAHDLDSLRAAYIDAHCLLHDHAGPARYDALDAARDALVAALRDLAGDRT